MFALGVWLYARTATPTDKAGKWELWALVAFLLAIYAGNLCGLPPPSVVAIAWVGQLQWLLVIWGYWVDGHHACQHIADLWFQRTTKMKNAGRIKP
jgi:hypothetical protein